MIHRGTGTVTDSEGRLGNLESRITELSAAVQDLREGLREVNHKIDSGLQEVNRRIDRLFLAILGVGGAILAALVVPIIRGL